MTAYAGFVATAIATWLDDTATRTALLQNLVVNGTELNYVRPATHGYEMDEQVTKIIVLASDETHGAGGTVSNTPWMGSASINIIVSYIPVDVEGDVSMFEHAQRAFTILMARLIHMLEEKRSFSYTEVGVGGMNINITGSPIRLTDYSMVSDVDEYITIFASMISLEVEFGYAQINPMLMEEIS